MSATLTEQLKAYQRNQYYVANLDRISAHRKEYYKQNSGIINAKKNQQLTTCPCGYCYPKQQQARHFRTKKHQSYLFNQRVEQQYQLCCKLYAESHKYIT